MAITARKLRSIDELISLVIVRGCNGFEFIARFTDPSHDFIITHRYKDAGLEQVLGRFGSYA